MNENISQYSTCFAFSGYFCYYNSIYTLAIALILIVLMVAAVARLIYFILDQWW